MYFLVLYFLFIVLVKLLLWASVVAIHDDYLLGWLIDWSIIKYDTPLNVATRL